MASAITPLHDAARVGDVDKVKEFLNHGKYNVNSTDSTRQTPLHHACEKGCLDVVRVLVSEFKADMTVHDGDGQTALMLAAVNSHENVVNALMSYGCPLDSNPKNGWTALHCACQRGSVRLVQSFLNTISVLSMDNEGNTPLHTCSSHGHAQCVEALLSVNAPVLIRNNSGKTPVDVAIGRSRTILDHYLVDNHHKLQVDYNAVLKLAAKRYSGEHPLARLFVLGNPGTGRSSLVESLKAEGIFQSFVGISESSVPPHTAGIVPSIHHSKYYGRVMFYDFAGDPEYYSSHAAILENLASSKTGDNIIIIVVDLRADDVTINTSLRYWVSFILHQRFKSKLSFVIVGSHSDLISNQRLAIQKEILEDAPISNKLGCFMLDCRKPRSMSSLQQQISAITSLSPRYILSSDASLLLGLLQKDFSNVTACSLQTVLYHIRECGVCLPPDAGGLYLTLSELHDLGLLLLLGDHTKGDCHIVLNISMLTNEAHEMLFSQSTIENLEPAFNIGVLPASLLRKILPPYISIQCLCSLQYCQEINYIDIVSFYPNVHSDQSFLFFPALCTRDRSDVSWVTSPAFSFSIGWLARCTAPYDYFPPRFLHVLLLRLVFRFTLSVHRAPGASPDHSSYQSRCTMWKTGVHWLMREGVECMVELVNGNKGVALLMRTMHDRQEMCVDIFYRILMCVMEAQEEFCHSIRPQFFLLDSTDEADYLNEDNLFSMNDIQQAFTHPKDSRMIISVTGMKAIKLSRVLFLLKLTLWNIFPMDFVSILRYLKPLVAEVYQLGLELKVPLHRLLTLSYDFPTDTKNRRRELVRMWLNSSMEPPCWWHLVRALRTDLVGREDLAQSIERDFGDITRLQEKLLEPQYQDLKPDVEFLESFAGVVGSRWPSLAASLSLSGDAIEEVKEGGYPQDCAFSMLMKWSSREDATYGQLHQALLLFSFSETLTSVQGIPSETPSSQDNKEDNEDELPEAIEEPSEDELVKAIEEAIARNGKITRRLAHSIFIGPPGSGKSSLMDRLLHKLIEKGFNKSTGVCKDVVVVDINPSTIKFACTMLSEDAWEEVQCEVSFLKHMTQESDLISPASGLASSVPLTACDDTFSSSSGVVLETKARTLPEEIQNSGPERQIGNNQESITLGVPLTPSVMKIGSVAVIAVPKQDILELIKKHGIEKFRNYLEKTSSLYLRDTGGQVEFQEILPLIISGPSVFFFVFRADQDFKSKFSIDYRKSETESLNCYTSSITIEEALLQCLASVHAMDIPNKGDIETHRPCVFIIGTHVDQIQSSVEDKIALLNQHIDSLIVKHGFENLVEYSDRDSGSVIFQVDNYSESDEQFKKIRSKVNSLVWGRDEFAVTYPVNYLMVCLGLQNVKRSILTLSEFRTLAAAHNVTGKEVLHLLHFMHLRVGIVRYYDVDGLRDIVVIQPQVLYNMITNLVLETYSCEAVRYHEAKDFKTEGIITPSVLQCVIDAAHRSGMTTPSSVLEGACDDHKKINPDVFLKLLVHLRIITQQKDRYFMPCVLGHVPEACEDSSRRDSIQIAIMFQCSHCPKGVFGVLVSHLMTPDLSKHGTIFELIPGKIFRNQVTFKVLTKGMLDKMSLKASSTHLELSFFPDFADDREVPIGEVCQGVREVVEKAIESSLKDLNYKVKPVVCIKCCNEACSRLHPIMEGARFHRFYCELTGGSSRLPELARCWYNEICEAVPAIAVHPPHRPLGSSTKGTTYQDFVSSLPVQACDLLDCQLDFDNRVGKDLSEIAHHMLDWEERLATHLELTITDINDINKSQNSPPLQRIDALRRWQDRNRPLATYRKLLRLFVEGGHTLCAETVCDVVRKKVANQPLSVSTHSQPACEGLLKEDHRMSTNGAVSNSVSQPSQAQLLREGRWMEVCGIRLSLWHERILSSAEQWLDDDIMAAVQLLLNKQHPHIQGLRPPAETRFPGANLVHDLGFVQILHVSCNHWVVISNIIDKSTPRTVSVYDSLNSKTMPVANLQHISPAFMPVQQQEGSDDCGLFAIAFATSLCFGQDPCYTSYYQARMRNHLRECLIGKRISPFPYETSV